MKYKAGDILVCKNQYQDENYTIEVGEECEIGWCGYFFPADDELDERINASITGHPNFDSTWEIEKNVLRLSSLSNKKNNNVWFKLVEDIDLEGWGHLFDYLPNYFMTKSEIRKEKLEKLKCQ